MGTRGFQEEARSTPTELERCRQERSQENGHQLGRGWRGCGGQEELEESCRQMRLLTRDEPGTRILYFQTSLGLDRVTNSLPKNNCGLLTNARYFTGRMHFLSPSQQRQSTEELLLYYRTVLLNFNSRFLEWDKDNEHSWGTQCIEGLLLSGVKIGPLWTPNLHLQHIFGWRNEELTAVVLISHHSWQIISAST